jgi:FO synthase
MMKTWAIVPYRDSSHAKSRLALGLADAARRELATAMLGDVLANLARSQTLSGVVLVGDAPPGLGFHHAKLHCIPCGLDLNGAIGAALADDVLRAADAVLIMHGDMPAIDGEEIDSFLRIAMAEAQEAANGYVRLAPCQHGDGTNLCFLPKGVTPTLQYGRGSFAAHRSAYAALGARVSIATPAPDVDTPADLQQLAERLALDPDLAPRTHELLERWNARWRGRLPRRAQVMSWATLSSAELLPRASAVRDDAFGRQLTYSRKVFLPVTYLCRDVCHYCTFAKTPRQLDQLYMSVEQVLDIAKRGAEQGCKEALFTLGDRPEARYKAAREELARLGFQSTLQYVAHLAERVLKETGLLPHINAGIMSQTEISELRRVSASMGLMLESSAERLCERGMPHHGSPDKKPAVRLQALRVAGEAQVPFTTGLLIGIGETREERLDSLLKLRRLHARYGHLQEILIQNFRAKPGTRMALAPEPDNEELLWTVAAARLVFGSTVSVQVPPNLSAPDEWSPLCAAGADDFGGISPVTVDHVNPEAPWPQIDALATRLARAGLELTERLTVYPAFIAQAETWLDPAVRPFVLRHADATGLARDRQWLAGLCTDVPQDWLARTTNRGPRAPSVDLILHRVRSGDPLSEPETLRLFEARGPDLDAVLAAADELRALTCGDDVGFVINRNINYTNLCTYHCGFCAFSTGKLSLGMREKPYLLDLDEVARRVVEAAQRGATEVCLQGGIHPEFTGNTYLDICRTVRSAVPAMHIHAFSPLEVRHGASTLGLAVIEFLARLQRAGLSTLPGTAAEILDDEVRKVICPDKLSTAEWLAVMRDAHSLGLRSTSTIMFGHVDRPIHWARHLSRLRDLQSSTGGFTEFVPLPFVAEGAPIYRRGRSRPGPTLREAVLMHAVARLALYPVIANIQASWVKMGEAGLKLCLEAGANDAGGTLMNESISRAAGAIHGQEVTPERMHSLIDSCGRTGYQRTTLYRRVHRAAHRERQAPQPELLDDVLADDAGSAAYC